MSTDWYTKLALTVLAVCAAIIAAQHLRGDDSRPDQGNRYTVQVFPMARMMLKTDTETGKVWRANFPELKVWLPIADEPVDTLDDAPPEPPAEPEDVEAADEAADAAAGEPGATAAEPTEAP